MIKLNDIIKFPKYELILPDSKKEKYFRPFNVREENTLLLSKQTDNIKILLKNLIEVMSGCFGEDVSLYSIPDFEYAFLKLREKSIGEIEKITINCPETQEEVDVVVNLIEDVVLHSSENNTNKISIEDDVFIELSEPTISTLLEIPDYKKDLNSSIKFIISCIKKIQNKKQIIEKEELNLEEMKEFIENLTSKQFKKILNYFEKQPKLYVKLKYNLKDGTEKLARLNGTPNLINFFFDHINIQTFYKLMFQMKYYHNYTLNEFYELLPWQRDVLVQLIINELEKEKSNIQG